MKVMTTADTRTDGKRWYILPDGSRLISVSTVVGYIDKVGLVPWAAGLAADAAYDNAEALLAARDVPPCDDAGSLDEGCGACWPCLRKWLATANIRVRDAAADLGNRVHDATEARDLYGDDEYPVDDDITNHYAAYKHWVATYRPQILATEAVVINRAWQYAGRLDKIVRFADDAPLPSHVAHLRGKTVVVDTKTGKHIGHPEGLQITGYAAAETIQLPDGSEEPMPVIDAGMILQLRPDKAQMRAVDTGPRNFAAFAAALTVAQTLTGPLGAIVSRPVTIYRTPKGD